MQTLRSSVHRCKHMVFECIIPCILICVMIDGYGLIDRALDVPILGNAMELIGMEGHSDHPDEEDHHSDH